MNRPYVCIKSAMSIDGKIGLNTSVRIIFSNQADKEAVNAFRSSFDGILVGESTLKKDNPTLLVKGISESKGPTKITISKKCDLDVTSNFFTRGSVPKYVFTTELASKSDLEKIKSVAEVFVVGKERVDISKLLEVLNEKGLKKLMIEGGGSTNFEFLNADVVDELRVAIAPKVLGGKDSPTLVDGKGFDAKSLLDFKLKDVEKLGEVIVLHYLRN